MQSSAAPVAPPVSAISSDPTAPRNLRELMVVWGLDSQNPLNQVPLSVRHHSDAITPQNVGQSRPSTSMTASSLSSASDSETPADTDSSSDETMNVLDSAQDWVRQCRALVRRCHRYAPHTRHYQRYLRRLTALLAQAPFPAPSTADSRVDELQTSIAQVATAVQHLLNSNSRPQSSQSSILTSNELTPSISSSSIRSLQAESPVVEPPAIDDMLSDVFDPLAVPVRFFDRLFFPSPLGEFRL